MHVNMADWRMEWLVQLISAVNCWLKCMWLDPYNQTDHPECKSRPDSGLSAITELDPGYITGTPCKFGEVKKSLPLYITQIETVCAVLITGWQHRSNWLDPVLMISVCDWPGPLSSVWKEWIKWCIEFGVEANAIIAVPYDWRLPPSKLEERDLYFHKLKFVPFIFSLPNSIVFYFIM